MASVVLALREAIVSMRLAIEVGKVSMQLVGMLARMEALLSCIGQVLEGVASTSLRLNRSSVPGRGLLVGMTLIVSSAMLGTGVSKWSTRPVGDGGVCKTWTGGGMTCIVVKSIRVVGTLVAVCDVS